MVYIMKYSHQVSIDEQHYNLTITYTSGKDRTSEIQMAAEFQNVIAIKLDQLDPEHKQSHIVATDGDFGKMIISKWEVKDSKLVSSFAELPLTVTLPNGGCYTTPFEGFVGYGDIHDGKQPDGWSMYEYFYCMPVEEGALDISNAEWKPLAGADS